MPDTEKLSIQVEQPEDPTKDLGVGRTQRAQDTKDVKASEKEDQEILDQEKKDNPYEQFLDDLEKEIAEKTNKATAKNFIETNRRVLVQEASLQLDLDQNAFVKYLRKCSEVEIELFSKKEDCYAKIHNVFTKGILHNKDLDDSDFWLIHNLEWLQSLDSTYYLNVWNWCKDINFDKIKKLAENYELDSLKSLSDDQLINATRKLVLNKTVFEEAFKSTDVSVTELGKCSLSITSAATSSKDSSEHEIYKSFLEGLANPKVSIDVITGKLKVDTKLQSKSDCNYLCQIFVDANLGNKQEQKEIISDKNKLKISQEVLKNLKKAGKLPQEDEKKLVDAEVIESISYKAKLNDLETFLNESLEMESDDYMTEYKYLAHDDEGQIKDKIFDKFEDAYDYCQDGLITFISELVYVDGNEDEDLEEIVWSWDDTHNRDEAIENVTSRHQTVEAASENSEIEEVTEDKPEEGVEFKAAAVEADNPVDFLNQIAKELGVEDEIKVVEVEPAESKFSLSDIPDVEFPEDVVTVDVDIPEDTEKIEDQVEDKLEDDELDEAKNNEDNLVNPGIKCDQDLKGTNNAVISDKNTKVVTHSEDERKTLNEEIKENIDLNLFEFTFDIPEYDKTAGEEDVSLDFYEDYYGLLAGKVYGTLSIEEDESGFGVKVRTINLTTVEFEDESKLEGLDRKTLEDKVIKEGTEYLEEYFDRKDMLLEDTHLKHAKTSEDPDERLIAYNAAVKRAHEENRGIVYGYTSRYSHGKWIPIELEPFTNRQDFEAKHHDVQTMLVAYPDDDFVEAEDKKDYAKLESCLSEAIQLDDEE